MPSQLTWNDTPGTIEGQHYWLGWPHGSTEGHALAQVRHTPDGYKTATKTHPGDYWNWLPNTLPTLQQAQTIAEPR